MSAGEGETLRRADLHQIEHHRASPGRDHVGQFGEVLGAALGDGVGKFGEPRPSHHVHVLDLDIAGRTVGCFEQEIDPRGLAVFHLAARRRVAGKLRDAAGGDRLGGERIGMAGVDADKLRAAAEVDLDQFPAMGELAVRIRRTSRATPARPPR